WHSRRGAPAVRLRDEELESSTPRGASDAAALDAARRRTIEPRSEAGRPVEGWVRVPVDFDPGKAPAIGDGAVPYTPPPRYPAAAVAAKQGGRVVLKLLVGVDGSVRDVVVEKSEPEGVFDAATVEAARNWRLAPMVEAGKPVEGWVRVPVDFDPDDDVVSAD